MQSIYVFNNDDLLEWVMEPTKNDDKIKRKKSAFAIVNDRTHDWS